MRHTPGPWSLDVMADGSMLIQPREGLCICPVMPRAGFDSDIPNFQLMAAAPDLLKCLEMAVEIIKNEYPSDQWGDYGVREMTAAIIKATGGPS